jgi:hypothetical protein
MCCVNKYGLRHHHHHHHWWNVCTLSTNFQLKIYNRLNTNKFVVVEQIWLLYIWITAAQSTDNSCSVSNGQRQVLLGKRCVNRPCPE